MEANASYQLAGANVSDTLSTAGPDVFFSGVDNAGVNIAEPVHGLGGVRVTTAGGSSAQLALNELEPGLGYLRDVAFDAANNQLWVADNANPAKLNRIDVASGQVQGSITLNAAAFGSTNFFGGLQVLGSAMTLNGVAVPAGSLLLFNGQTNPDRVSAVNPSSGAVIATLVLAANYDLTAGVYDPASGHLLVNNRAVNPNVLLEIDPANAALLNTYALPFNATEAGMAIDPLTGNLWYGSDQGNNVAEFSLTTHSVLRQVNLALQGVDNNEISGLAFDATGALLVASTQGVVYKVDPDFDPAKTAPTLTAVIALAADGTPANALQASANVGQVIELTGSNFGANTQVLFNTRDNAGNSGVAAQTPLVISSDGTRMQVIVPDLASTGDIKVVNTGAGPTLGFNSYPDAIYRNVTLSFTPGSSSATLRFGDDGLQDISDESWGLDNVRVSQGATTVFSDTFEGAAQAQWSQSATDNSVPGVFTRFSGRFGNLAQTLTLSGLTAGQATTLSFDLYVLDSWDGTNTSSGPDQFEVSADGQLLMREAFSNFSHLGQTFNASTAQRLQIVPTLSALANGRSGSDASFDLIGSGFMEGASTISIGGKPLADGHSNQPDLDVTGARNSDYRLAAPLTLDGPIQISTEGGSATLAGPAFAPQPLVQFTGIQASAQAGLAADASKPAANTGQAIVLQGQGFTSQTLVQFEGVDDSGTAGTLTRTGSPSGDGRSLTLDVPALARSGLVHVLGASTSFELQVVPTLRSVGGAISTGNTIELEGSGLVGPELQIQIDGRGVGSFDVRTIFDSASSASPDTQQLVRLTVPSAVSAGLISVSTAGGTSTLRTGASLSSDANDVPASDVGDTLATARTLALASDHRVSVQATLGDGAQTTKDVDLYRVDLAAGDVLRLSMDGSSFYSHLRVFDAAGVALADQYMAPSGNPLLLFKAPAAGSYTIGVSGYYNTAYDPTQAGSGDNAGNQGTYQLSVERRAAGSSLLSGIQASATHGTPAQAGVAAANVGQTITLTGSQLQANEPLVFTAIDGNGTLYERTVAAASVAANGTSLTVVVPGDATTGTVRLARDQVGVLLQIVPTLDDVSANPGQPFAGGGLTLTGSGFAEGASSVQFGAASLADSSRASGLDVYYRYNPNYTENGTLALTAPNGPTGPIRVSTVGGSSEAFALSFTGLVASATTGAAADAAQASANPGQLISIQGAGLDASTDVVFQTIDSAGNRSEVVVRPTTVDASGNSAQVVVPYNAASGTVRVVGDQNATAALLQIVPVVQSIDVTSVSADGTSAQVTLSGLGLIEDNASEYRFGTSSIVDGSASTGPDVGTRYDASLGQYIDNGVVYLSVPLSNATFGAITVRSAGGVSAPLSLELSGIEALALSGTPADAGEASANAGQAITLQGSGLSTASDVLLRYVDSGGIQRMVLLNPSAAASDGSSATLVVPGYANGAFGLQMLGASGQPLLQVVPTLSGYNVSGTTLQLFGSALVEANASYQLAGANVSDTLSTAGPDVFFSGVDNAGVNIAEPVHGLGGVRVTTAGGSSAQLALNELEPGLGYLRDVAFDAANNQLWVADNANPAKLNRIDVASGQVQGSITLNAAAFGSTNFFGGLQVLGSAMTLNGVAVPAGSLLLFNGQTNPDRVSAVNPSSGAVIATLVLAANYDLTAGVYDPASGHLLVNNRAVNPNVLLEIDPANAALLNTYALPFNATEAGMAIDPLTGNLWYGSDQGNNVAEFSLTTHSVLRQVNLALQGVDNNEISGLAFDATGALLVASTQGVVYRVNAS